MELHIATDRLFLVLMCSVCRTLLRIVRLKLGEQLVKWYIFASIARWLA